MEVGPYRLKDSENLEYNDGSWDEFANIMFVDNPVGTGFSYVDSDSYLHELPEMAAQFVVFLEKWFKMFPEYEHDDVCINLMSRILGTGLLSANNCSRFISQENHTLDSTSRISPRQCWTVTRLAQLTRGTLRVC